jgi:hypothetical protein
MFYKVGWHELKTKRLEVLQKMTRHEATLDLLQILDQLKAVCL